MTITIDLPEHTLANLNERAQAQGRPAAELVAEVVTERFGADHDAEDFPLDADAVEKIRRGLAEVEAGQTMSLEEARADFKASFSKRYRDATL